MTTFEKQALQYLKAIRDDTRATLVLLSREYTGTEPEPAEPTCRTCNSQDVVEDRAFGEGLRLVCRSCHSVTVPEQEAVNG